MKNGTVDSQIMVDRVSWIQSALDITTIKVCVILIWIKSNDSESQILNQWTFDINCLSLFLSIDQDCVQMLKSNGKWDDLECDELLPSVCEGKAICGMQNLFHALLSNNCSSSNWCLI